MTDAYKIGITVALTNVISSELLKIIGQFGSADKAALGFVGKLGLVAGAVGIVGTALAAGVDEARKFQIETAKFSLFGMSDRVNADATRFAESMKVVGTSATEAMRLMVEAQGVFRESGLSDDKALIGAKLSAPMLAKIDFVSKALDGENATKLHTSAQAMLRFLDMQGGLNDPEKFNQIANAGFKAIRSSGGNIDWEQYRQFRAIGGSAASNLTDEALFGEFEPIIQELKTKSGFGLGTAYSRLNGIILLPNQAAHEMVKSGAWDASKIEWNTQGGIKKFLGNPLIDSALYAQDPVKWYEKHLLPYYNSLGLTREERTRENALMVGKTGGQMFDIIERQNPAIHRSVDAWNKAMGIDEAVQVAKNTVDGQLVDLTAQWATLMQNIGKDLLPATVGGLQALVKALGWLNDFLDWRRSPESNNTLNAMKVAVFGGNHDGGLVNAVPSPANQNSVIVDHQTILDGRVLTKSVTEYQVKGMAQAPSSGTGFDGRMSSLWVN